VNDNIIDIFVAGHAIWCANALGMGSMYYLLFSYYCDFVLFMS